MEVIPLNQGATVGVNAILKGSEREEEREEGREKGRRERAWWECR